MAAFVRTILKKPHVKPLLLNCSTFGALYGAGELTQQSKAIYYDKEIQQYDLPRARNFWLIGTFVFPPLLYPWYKFLESRPWLIGTSPQAILGKVLIDQAVSASISTGLFYIIISWLEGKEDIFKECREKFKSTYIVSLCFWPIVQTINFRLIPQYARVVFVALACFIWANILSMQSNKRFVPETFRVVYIGAAAFIWVNLLSICKTKGIDIEGKIKKVLGIKKE